MVVDTGDCAGQPRIIGPRTDGEFLHLPMMGSRSFRRKAAIPMFHDINGDQRKSSEWKSLYDTDLLARSKQQAKALRAATRNGSNQRLDLGNLAEEIEDLAKSVSRELQSQI